MRLLPDTVRNEHLTHGVPVHTDVFYFLKLDNGTWVSIKKTKCKIGAQKLILSIGYLLLGSLSFLLFSVVFHFDMVDGETEWEGIVAWEDIIFVSNMNVFDI